MQFFYEINDDLGWVVSLTVRILGLFGGSRISCEYHAKFACNVSLELSWLIIYPYIHRSKPFVSVLR